MPDEKQSAFNKKTYFSLETFRKNGQAVRTPVWFTQSGDLYFVQTGEQSGKVKRIRRNPKVRIAPCTGSGKITGEWVEATAQVTTDENQIKEAERLANQKYGLIKKIFEWMNSISRPSTPATLMIRLN